MSGRELGPVLFAATAWSSALSCVFFESIAWLCALLLWAGTVVAVLWRSTRGTVTAGFVALALTLGACVASSVAFAVPERAAVREHAGYVIEVVAEVTSKMVPGRDGRLWFDARTIAIGPSGAQEPNDAVVRIGIEVPESGVPRDWQMGAQLSVTGTAQPSGAGERAALVIFGRGSVAVIRAPGFAFTVAAEVREAFVARALTLPEPGAGLLPGLAVGDTRAVSEELNDAMLATGLSHLTAVSGANCAIVVGVVYAIVALLRGGRRLRIALAAAALGAFVILVTPEPSVIRAATMAGLAMLALLLGRPGAGVGILSLAVCVILVIDPWLAATPGFALSAAATAALLLLARPVSRGLSRWMPQPLALGIAVPLSAQLVCGPILALFADRQTLVGVLANMLAAPAAPVATVIGLLACLAMPFPLLADLLASSAWLPSAWIATTALTATTVPGSHFTIAPGIVPALIIAVLTLAVTLLLVRGRSGAAPPRLLRAASILILAIAVGLGTGRMLLTGPLAPMTAPEGWSIAVCDVGQGDAILLRSAERIALIDTGPEPAALNHCLGALGVDRIHLLVITHFDLDHYGGVETLLGRVDTVLHGPSESGHTALGSLAASGARVIEGYAGQRGALGQAEWRVLWPPRQTVIFEPGNDTSLVFEFSGAEVPRSLFLGDLGAFAQRQLLGSGGVVGPYAVVKVAHHGSRDQEPALYATARPTIALFTVGENSYGHPHPDALVMVHGAYILRTDLHGRVLLRSDTAGMSVWTER